MKGSLNQYLLRVIVFIFAIIIVSIYLYPVLRSAFYSNIYINSVIILSLFFGIVYCLYNLKLLIDNHTILANFNIRKSPQHLKNASGILKNIIVELTEKDGQYKFKSSRTDKIIETIDMNLLRVRETSRYLVGLLVFLGLLGTFWGLLKTIGSVGNVISGLGIDNTNLASFFDNLKDGLNAPLSGMSIAFSSSLLGLAGSLILGFVDLQLGQAQSKFSQFVEKTIIDNSTPDFISPSNIDKLTLTSIQKIYDNLENLVFSMKETSRNQKEIYYFVQSLTDQIREITTLVRDQEKKLSKFLSTQLNTQSNIDQLSSQLTKEGLVDKKTKLHLYNIDKGIKQLITKIKK